MLITKGAEMLGGSQCERVMVGKWTTLTCIAQKFSKLPGLCEQLSGTFEKGRPAWITSLGHLWALTKVLLPDFQHVHGLLPVGPGCLIRDAVWLAPSLPSGVTCVISGDARKSLCAGGFFRPLST